MKKTIARYIRVSTVTQQTASQEKANPDERVFTDKITGSIPFKDRPAGAKLMEAIERGEISEVRIYSVDRVGRKAADILSVMNYWKEKGVRITIDQLNISSMDDAGKPNFSFDLVTGILACISQSDRENILEKQQAGIRAAQALKIYKGRKPGTGLTDKQIIEKYPKVAKELKKNPNDSLQRIGKLCEVAPNTVKRVKKALANMALNKAV